MKYTKEEVITMMYGMLYMGGLCRTERETIEAAIDYLEKEGEEKDNDEC